MDVNERAFRRRSDAAPRDRMEWAELKMSFLSDFAEGFLVLIVATGILYTQLIPEVLSHLWLVLFFLMIVSVPVSIILYTHLGHQTNDVDRLRSILVSLNGVALACWVFDVGSTYYAIDILGVFAEENPLGWPFGALGALVFYVPALAFTYLLLFKIRQKVSLFAGILLTLLLVFMGSMNLLAGLQNFGCTFNYFAVLLEMTFIFLFLIVNISRRKRRGS